ncbi:MAG: helix-turn-helix transcriptional regulator [Rhodospirillales bacterium]|nr:helix-turn-helix transcriptional regulator [Rhodospirillales bacterium]
MSRGLNSLISTLYATAQDNDAWATVSDELRHFTDGDKTVFAVRKWADREILNAYQYGFELPAFEVYEEYYFKVDLYTSGLASQAVNQFHAQHQFIHDRDFLNSEIYADFAAPNDIRYLTGCVTDIPGTGLFGQLSTIRGHGGEEFNDDILAQLNLLTPHFRQTLLLGQKIQQLETDLRSRERIVDSMPEAVFILSADCQVLYRNAAADALLSRSGLIKLANRHLTLAGPDPTNRLHKLAKGACDAAAGKALAGGNAFQIEDDNHFLEITAFPFHFRRDGEAGHLGRSATLLIVNDSEKKPALNEETLKALYNLTASEAAVTGLLARGLSPLEIADERTVSLDTVRTQIRSIHQKTGCNNQIQLLSKILGGVSRFS